MGNCWDTFSAEDWSSFTVSEWDTFGLICLDTFSVFLDAQNIYVPLAVHHAFSRSATASLYASPLKQDIYQPPVISHLFEPDQVKGIR